MFLKHAISVFACGALPCVGLSAPVITALEGNFYSQKIVTITGSEFGEKKPAKPLVWADFESGLQPSQLGQKASWYKVQNMETTPHGWQGKGARASDGSGKWRLGVEYHDWTKEAQKLYVFKHQKMNFLVTDRSQNWKSWRMWPAHTNYPNIYISPSNGRVFVENIEPESGFWGEFRIPTTDWYTEEIIFRASSFIDRKDGLFILKYNGEQVASGTLITRSSRYPDYMSENYVVHGVEANWEQWNPPWSDTNRLWVDDVYVDTTWARVMFGDAPIISLCRHWEIQIPVSWSPSEIKFHANTGSVASGMEGYLYVFNDKGEVNPSGFPVKIGSAKEAGKL